MRKFGGFCGEGRGSVGVSWCGAGGSAGGAGCGESWRGAGWGGLELREGLVPGFGSVQP